jgi:hypothetical protein
VPRLYVGAAEVGDLDRAEGGFDARLDDAAGLGRRARLVVCRDMLCEVAVGNRGNGGLTPLSLPLARRIGAIGNRGLLTPRLPSRLLRG